MALNANTFSHFHLFAPFNSQVFSTCLFESGTSRTAGTNNKKKLIQTEVFRLIRMQFGVHFFPPFFSFFVSHPVSFLKAAEGSWVFKHITDLSCRIHGAELNPLLSDVSRKPCVGETFQSCFFPSSNCLLGNEVL